jgi:hypothetical protein
LRNPLNRLVNDAIAYRVYSVETPKYCNPEIRMTSKTGVIGVDAKKTVPRFENFIRD